MLESDKKLYSNKGNKHVFNSISGFGKHILDVGCGDGSLAKRLVGESHVVDGITLSQDEADAAGIICRKVYIYNLENGLPEGISDKYDYIICSHVLEHICYPTKLLSDIKDRLKPEGEFIVALPNVMHYKSRIQLVMGNFNYREAGIWDYTHFRWYTFVSGAKLLTDNGFTLKKSWVTGKLPFYSILKLLPVVVERIVFKMLSGVSKGFFGNQLLYVSKKN